jgi:hypothetical protein
MAESFPGVDLRQALFDLGQKPPVIVHKALDGFLHQFFAGAALPGGQDGEL